MYSAGRRGICHEKSVTCLGSQDVPGNEFGDPFGNGKRGLNYKETEAVSAQHAMPRVVEDDAATQGLGGQCTVCDDPQDIREG